MGDKGGRKDKEKERKQDARKQKEKAQKKQDKLPKRKVLKETGSRGRAIGADFLVGCSPA